MESVPLKERLARLRDLLCEGLVEREVAVRVALLAALAGEHVLLVGPPGTAKSEVARRLRLAFRGASWFERLLTRFTVPEELFGPLSITALERDVYRRQTEGYLPTASVAFLDEVFKGNSAILNALLTLLNEREFDNGTAREKTPLVCVVAATNELPEESDGVEALYDRFLLRCHVGPVSEGQAFARMVGAPATPPAIPAALQLTPEDLAEVRAGAARVRLGDGIVHLLGGLRRHLCERGIAVSDRRWKKIAQLLRVSAWTDGRDKVSIWDCALLQHCTWERPEQREEVQAWYEARAGAAQASDPAQFLRLTEAWEKRVETLRTELEQDRDARGRPLFVSPDGVVTTDARSRAHKSNPGGERLYKAPVRFAEITHDQLHPRGSPYAEFLAKVEGGVTTRELLIYSSLRARPGEFDLMAYTGDPAHWVLEELANEPRMRPRRLSSEGAARLAAETAEHHKLAGDQLRRIDGLLASLGTTVAHHLWIDASIGVRVRPRLEAAQGEQGVLKARWDALADKVAQLPRAGQKGA
jgi:MoxR-like ATPase